MRRKADEDRNFLRNKNTNFKKEVEELISENKKMLADKTQMTSRLTSQRQMNKQLEKKLDTAHKPLKENPLYIEMN